MKVDSLQFGVGRSLNDPYGHATSREAGFPKVSEVHVTKNMDNSSVQNLIDKLRDLSATKFAETGGGNPVFEATVTSNEGKRVEKVTIRKQGERLLVVATQQVMAEVKS